MAKGEGSPFWVELAQTISVLVGKPNVVLRIHVNPPNAWGIGRVILFRFSRARIDSYELTKSEHTGPHLALRIHFDVIKLGISIQGRRWLTGDVIPSFDRILRVGGRERNPIFLELFLF